jgi:hypothetical protein
MSSRHEVIADSIQHAITHSDKRPGFFNCVPGFFYIHWLTFECVRVDLFKGLRDLWEIKDEDYLASFGGKEGNGDVLKSMGDMGKHPLDSSVKPCS